MVDLKQHLLCTHQGETICDHAARVSVFGSLRIQSLTGGSETLRPMLWWRREETVACMGAEYSITGSAHLALHTQVLLQLPFSYLS